MIPVGSESLRPVFPPGMPPPQKGSEPLDAPPAIVWLPRVRQRNDRSCTRSPAHCSSMLPLHQRRARSAKLASTSATCSAVIWSTVARRSRVTGCPQARSRTNSRQKASWLPRNPSASCLASSSSSVSCIYLLLVTVVPGGLLLQTAKLQLEHVAYI